MTTAVPMLPPGLIADDQLPAAIAWINSQHALVYDGSKTLIWSQVRDAVLGRHHWRQSSVSDFRTFYQAYLVQDGKRMRSLAEVWLAHEDARRYRDVVFDPTEQVGADCLNLWRGFAVVPAEGDWSRLREHLYEVVASGNAELYDYLIGWMARMVQVPQEPGGTAIVLRGTPGAGKGILVKSLGRLLGEHFVHISHMGQLTSRFNGHLADALLVFADESVWAGDKQGDGAIKAIITEPTLAIERKGREIMTVKNVTHVMMASNQSWAAPVGARDRRFVVLDVPDSRVGDNAYFDALGHEQANGGGPALLYDLLHYDLSTFRSGRIPDTIARRDQIIASMDPLSRWLMDRLTDGLIGQTALGDDPQRIERSKVYDDYLATMTKWHVTHPMNHAWFGREMRRLLPKMASGFGTWERHYTFDPLAQCRMAFERAVGTPLPWPSEAASDRID